MARLPACARLALLASAFLAAECVIHSGAAALAPRHHPPPRHAAIAPARMAYELHPPRVFPLAARSTAPAARRHARSHVLSRVAAFCRLLAGVRRLSSAISRRLSFAFRSHLRHSAPRLPLPPARSAAARRSPLAAGPTQRQERQRRYLMRRLVLLDTEGQLLRMRRSRPWEYSGALREQIRSLEMRSPLLHWLFRHQVALLGTTGIKVVLGSPSAVVPALASVHGVSAERNEELKAALMTVSPVFFELVAEAIRKKPGAAPRLYRRVAQAASTLGAWRAAIFLKASPNWRYSLMNQFLRRLIEISSECQAILEQREDLALRCDEESCEIDR
ncbi:hypothetical protein AB1Y20_014025 [Prymnesium parvum]|uniref:Uncharacterized protein n=1 Tax=Prymnesium parvum TaxID=97485 RepID=A0AB34IFU5_PRYPA